MGHEYIENCSVGRESMLWQIAAKTCPPVHQMVQSTGEGWSALLLFEQAQCPEERVETAEETVNSLWQDNTKGQRETGPWQGTEDGTLTVQLKHPCASVGNCVPIASNESKCLNRLEDHLPIRQTSLLFHFAQLSRLPGGNKGFQTNKPIDFHLGGWPVIYTK